MHPLRAIVPLLLAASCLAGCGLRRDGAAGGSTGAQPITRGRPAAVGPLDHIHVDEVSPVEGGPGVVVFEPEMAAGVEASVARFADACGRWLHLAVAGHPEFGGAASLEAIDRARVELRRENLRATPELATQYAPRLGASHLVVLNASMDGGQLVLTCRVLDRGGSAQGDPVVARGSLEEVRQRLPVLAQQLAERIGLASPGEVISLTETVDELQALGALTWPPGKAGPPELRGELGRMQERSLLAWVAARIWDNYHSLKTEGGPRNLSDLAPDNQVAWGMLGWSARVMEETNYWREHADALGRDDAAQRFPRSSLLRMAQARVQLSSGRAREGKRHAFEAVRAAPDNPETWAIWGDTVGSTLNQLGDDPGSRQGTPEEQDVIRKTLRQAAPAIYRRAVELDPGYARAWQQLSTTLAQLGQEEFPAAEEALWRSIELDPNEWWTYRWGLIFYGPGWNTDAAQRQKVAERAVRGKFPTPENRQNVARVLFQSGFADQAQQVLANDRERAAFQEWLAETHPEAAAQ